MRPGPGIVPRPTSSAVIVPRDIRVDPPRGSPSLRRMALRPRPSALAQAKPGGRAPSSLSPARCRFESALRYPPTRALHKSQSCCDSLANRSSKRPDKGPLGLAASHGGTSVKSRKHAFLSSRAMTTETRNPAGERKIAILQSNYIPWKGYFDLIAAVDEFIIYDDMQYTRRDWRNRNQIKTPQGRQWLTVPVQVKGKYHQKIRDTEIDGTDWAENHWRTIAQNYAKAPHFKTTAQWLEPIYRDESFTHITQLNVRLIRAICESLGIYTKISMSWDHELADGRTERLANLCRQCGGTEYISGPSARGYVDDDVFKRLGIKVTWFDYLNYPSYPQLWGDFVHEVSILDLILNCGPESANAMRYVRPG